MIEQTLSEINGKCDTIISLLQNQQSAPAPAVTPQTEAVPPQGQPTATPPAPVQGQPAPVAQAPAQEAAPAVVAQPPAQPAAVPPAQAPTAVPAQPAAQVPATTPAPAGAVSEDDLKALGMQLLQAGKMAEYQGIVSHFGVAKVSEIPAERQVECHQMLSAEIQKLAAQ